MDRWNASQRPAAAITCAWGGPPGGGLPGGRGGSRRRCPPREMASAGGRLSLSRFFLRRRKTGRRHRIRAPRRPLRAASEPLQHLSRSLIDLPQIALVTFPGAMPELALDPGDPGNKAVGLDGAKNRPCLGIDLINLPVPILPAQSVPSAQASPQSLRRRRAPGSSRVHDRSSDRSSGCDPRQAETGACRRRRFLHARRHRSSARSSPARGSRRRSACLRTQTKRADRQT